MVRRAQRLLQLAAGGPNILSFVVVALMITAGVYFLWSRFSQPGSRLLSVEAIQLKQAATEGDENPPPLAERGGVEQPSWILADVKADVFRDASLDKISIRDPDAVKLVGEAFMAHTWVARVEQVIKQYPGTIYVALEYRTPAALVEVDHEQVAKLQPVDAAGHVLPTDFLAQNPDSISNYLRILVDRQMPSGAEGSSWGDPRVQDAARIAYLLRDVWKDLQAYRIRAFDVNLEQAPTTNYALTDVAEKSWILWGAGPGKELPGEASPQVKLTHIRSLLQQSGPMTSLTAPADLRDPQQVRLVNPQTARSAAADVGR